MHAKVKALLKRCQDKKFLIEFDRRPQIAERIAGFVLDFNDSWILLHLLEWNTFTLNGYIIIRVQDIKRQKAFDTKSCWQSKATKANKLKPVDPDVSIASLEEAVRSICKEFPVITIETELVDDDACWIGKLSELTPKTLSIYSLNTKAEWKGEDKFILKDITRLAFGGGYETALALSAKKFRKI